MVTGLLLIAFIFFVFAQAAISRNGAQSAADAAALAAAQAARDEMFGDFLDAVDDGGDVGDIVDGDDQASGACPDTVRAEAEQLAASNDADVVSCDMAGAEFTVVVNAGAIGDSVVPGTESQVVEADATAVISALCEEGGEGDNGGDGGDRGENGEDPVELDCDDGEWTINPDEDEEDALPEARDLFDVYLED